MKERIQISINPELVKAAHELMRLRKFDSFSGLLETLIREEHERRPEKSVPAVLVRTDTLNEPAPRTVGPVSYKIPRKK